MDIVNLVIEFSSKSKYLLLFVLYFVEGSASNFVSSLLASTGALDISIVFTLVISAEILGDVTYFLLGRYLPQGYVDRKVAKYEESGLLHELEKAVTNHPVLTLTILKVTGFLSIPGLFYMGRKRILPFAQYIFYAILICFVKNGVISYLGYYVGLRLESFFQYYNIYVFINIFILVAIVLFFVVKVNKKKIEELFRKIIKRLG